VQLLRDDDSLLRQVFFNVLRHHHPNTANKVDVIYALSQVRCCSVTPARQQRQQGHVSKQQQRQSRSRGPRVRRAC
jgi:hypothetical protein